MNFFYIIRHVGITPLLRMQNVTATLGLCPNSCAFYARMTLLRQISMIDCKIHENKLTQHVCLQMYELTIIQFQIDCNFWKNQDGVYFINGD